MQPHRLPAAPLLLPLTLIGVILFTACEPGEFLEVANETGVPVVVEVLDANGNAKTHELAPGDSFEVWVPESDHAPAFRVLDPPGHEPYRVWPSWEELQAMDFRYALR